VQPLRRNGSTSTGMGQHQPLDVVERANDDRHIESALLFDRSPQASPPLTYLTVVR